jgi:cytochrome c2
MIGFDRKKGPARNGGRRIVKRLHAGHGVCLVALVLVVPLPLLAWVGDEPAGLGDVIRGWRVFHEKRCVDCHAVWGQGSQIGPDLGRVSRSQLSSSELTAQMWNHVPRMVALLKQYRISEVTLTRDEMADMFSFLYFARQLDQPGDPREGSRVLVERRCAECHSLEHERDQVGPDLTRWAGNVNPIVWAQLMWGHGTGMAQAMKLREIEWPKLDDDDLANIIAYVRSIGPTATKTYLRPGSSVNGQRLFKERQCAACHSPDSDPQHRGPDLVHIELPRSLSGVASRMWNHLPAMSKLMADRNVQVAPITAQEMSDIIAFIFAQQYQRVQGEPSRGRTVFQQKRCAACHTLAPRKDGSDDLAPRDSAVDMADAVWKHGAAMVDQMAAAGIPWPLFEGTEMADLVAHIGSVGRLTVHQPALKAPVGAARKEGPSSRSNNQ